MYIYIWYILKECTYVREREVLAVYTSGYTFLRGKQNTHTHRVVVTRSQKVPGH